MPFSRAIDDAFASAQPEPDFQPGWYQVRATSACAITASTGTRGLRIGLVFVDGPYAGLIRHRDFWLGGRAVAFSKHQLETLGFGGLLPSEIECFTEFERLPPVAARLVRREFNGRVSAEFDAIAAEVPVQ